MITTPAVSGEPGQAPAEFAADLPARADRLGFSDDTAAAYHARKHLQELPEGHQDAAEPVGGYFEALREALGNARVVQSEPVPGLDGVGESTLMVIHGDVDGKTMEALVYVNEEGRAVVATFGAPKVVR